jgi:hypothetical protein
VIVRSTVPYEKRKVHSRLIDGSLTTRGLIEAATQRQNLGASGSGSECTIHFLRIPDHI